MKQKLFDSLCEEVRACQNCDRMRDSSRVLSSAAGPLDVPLMFIGEAPGRLGADESQIPFHGDTAGGNFENFLNQVGISRYDIFVTNAVLCNPKDEKGNNATPNNHEVSNCAGYLKKQIDIVNPSIIVTLGGLALKALKGIENHEYELSKQVRHAANWYNRILIPLYHPGQRALIHRNFHNQLADYQFVAEHVRRLNRPIRKQVNSRIKDDVIGVVDLITALKPSMTYFALHKLLYLAECESVKETGFRITSAYFIRQKDGPYCTDIHSQRLKKNLENVSFSSRKGQLIIERDIPGIFGKRFEEKLAGLNEKVASILMRIIEKYGDKTNEELKTSAYLSKPMRTILRLENKGLNLFNAPIDFSCMAESSQENRAA